MLKTSSARRPFKPPENKRTNFSHLLLTECESLPAMALSLLPLLGLAVVLFPGAIFWAILQENRESVCVVLLFLARRIQICHLNRGGQSASTRAVTFLNGQSASTVTVTFPDGQSAFWEVYDVTV